LTRPLILSDDSIQNGQGQEPPRVAREASHGQEECQAAEEMGLEGARHHTQAKNISPLNDTEKCRAPTEISNSSPEGVSAYHWL